MFVGDLGEGDLKTIKAIKKIPIPTAVILGNHDRGYDGSGDLLKIQLRMLGDLHCGWDLREWDFPLVSVIGARPCSSGGGFHLSKEVKAIFGPISLEESAEKIVLAAKKAHKDLPLIILAHSGPSGLGSEASSPCGRDWKRPYIDWGDKDLAIAIDKIRMHKVPNLVVFGHTHHELKNNAGVRKTFARDQWGTAYLNTAAVPRSGYDSNGNLLTHFSWVEFKNGVLNDVSHRWYREDGSIAYNEQLYTLKPIAE